MAMDEHELATIEARAATCDPDHPCQCHDDLPLLVAEVRRLQAELARYAGLEAVAAEAAQLRTLKPESNRWLQALGRYGAACDRVWRDL